MDLLNNSGVFEPVSHPLAFTPKKHKDDCNGNNNNVYAEAGTSPSTFHEHHDSQDASRSFEMAEAVMGNEAEDTNLQPTITVHTTVSCARSNATAAPASSSRTEQHSVAVHVDPHRSHTVAAAAAKKRSEAEADVEPLTAENETWGHWSFRHTWNGVVMLLLGLYQVTQASVRKQPADINTITYTNSVYMSAPPRAEELKMNGGSIGSAEAAP